MNLQVEQSLKCALECQLQTSASTRYMPIPPQPSRMEAPSSGNAEFLSYPQYIALAKQQTQFTNEIRQLLTQVKAILRYNSNKCNLFAKLKYSNKTFEFDRKSTNFFILSYCLRSNSKKESELDLTES